MLICGVKVSHDGGVAVLDNDRLLFSVEVEKLANAPRYSPLGDVERVGEILAQQGIAATDVDRFVVDGWWDEAGIGRPSIRTRRAGSPYALPVADYLVRGRGTTPLDREHFSDPVFGGTGYASYSHTAGHVLAAYATSPFADAAAPSLVLAWDGGITPQLYLVDPVARRVTLVAPLMAVIGNLYPHLCGSVSPFDLVPALIDGDPDRQRRQLEVSGKAMAYAALGLADAAAFGTLDELLKRNPPVSDAACVVIAQEFRTRRDSLFPGLSSADLIATVQDYLGARLVDSLSRVVLRRFAGQRPNLCVGGGCALNIKWNSTLRSSGLFADVWVPPFPNDSGAAIGAAAAEWFTEGGGTGIRWDVFSGPDLVSVEPPAGWTRRSCSPVEVAELLHRRGEPVVVLDGRAELGPRALGHRSIVAPAVDPAMKDRLNEMKGRAAYRPVAPICLESQAETVFDPGGEDRYMLFDHRPRAGWADRIPAVVHLDGTARLQTVDDEDPSGVVQILRAYAEISGIPVLCNTSANLNGSGFFPDVATAAAWGRSSYVWSAGFLYVSPEAAYGSEPDEAVRQPQIA